jgi:hypothetical protein
MGLTRRFWAQGQRLRAVTTANRSRGVIAPMGDTKTINTNPRRRLAYAFAFAALCIALVAVAVSLPSADAITAKVLGRTKHEPKAACPNKKHPNRCKAIGRVTGFMRIADGEKHPFRVPKDGKLVAWAVDLGKPPKEGRNRLGTLFQNKDFGKQPTGRIAVLKHKDNLSYKLRDQGPTMRLGGDLGRKQIFTLDKPVSARKGDIVAFTSPTWTPNFRSHGLSRKGDQWRASRTKDNCSTPRNPTEKQIRRFARKSHPQQKVGSVHDYECLYSHGRILYWAYFVPNKRG